MSEFDLIESLFSQIMPALKDILFPSEFSLISEFIDVGEYGLALEEVVDNLVDREQVASTDLVALINALAIAMNLPAKEFSERLRTAEG